MIKMIVRVKMAWLWQKESPPSGEDPQQAVLRKDHGNEGGLCAGPL